MVYVRRDNSNRVISLSLVETPEHRESLPADAPELAGFVRILTRGQGELATTDQDMARVLEDLIHLLLEHDVIRFTDFPQAAQEKLLARSSMRCSLRSLKLLEEEKHGDGLL